jgi:general secretion pathway protein B
MSFILDALKKSENERQRQAGPALATVPTSVQKGSGKKWLTILVISMAVVIGILAIMLVRTDAPPRTIPAQRPIVASPPATQATNPVAVTRPPQRAENDIPQAHVAAVPEKREVRSLRDEARVGGGESATRADLTSTATAARPSPQPTTTTPPKTRSTDASQLPTARDLFLQGALTSIPLHLDLHIYSDEPARRAVFVNGKKYREGDQILNGPRVREIVPEGVVLDDGRQRFLLDPD